MKRLVIFIFLFFVNCGQQEFVNDFNNEIDWFPKYYLNNSINPFDTLGAIHNALLNSLFNYGLENFVFLDGNSILIDSSINLMRIWLGQQFQNLNINLSEWSHLDPILFQIYSLNKNDSLLYFVESHTPGTFTNIFKEKLFSYFQFIQNCETAKEIIEQTKILENMIQDEQNLTSDEKSCLYAVFAISKYSASFWENLVASFDTVNYSLRYSPKNAKIQKNRNYERWVANLTISDAAGAYFGFVAGVSGGPIGMGVGALVGGVSSSAISGFLKWLNI